MRNQASAVSIIAVNLVRADRHAALGLELAHDFADEPDVIRAVHLGDGERCHARIDRGFEVEHRLPPRPVDAHDHVGAAARNVLGGRDQVAPRRRPLGDRHAVFQIDDDRVGAAPVRAVDEARHVRRHVERRTPDRQLAIAHMTFLLRRSSMASALKTEAAEDFVVVFAERRRRRADLARRARQARHHRVHRDAAHLVVRQFGHDLARPHMRVGDELVDLVDRRGGHFRGLEHRKPFGQGARLDEVRDHAVAFVDVAHAIRVGAEARIVDHVGAADRAEQPLRHGLDRGRDRDEAAVLGFVDVARRGVVRAAADARLDRLRELVDRGFRPEHREDRIEQRQVDHLARAAMPRSRAARPARRSRRKAPPPCRRARAAAAPAGGRRSRSSPRRWTCPRPGCRSRACRDRARPVPSPRRARGSASG